MMMMMIVWILRKKADQVKNYATDSRTASKKWIKNFIQKKSYSSNPNNPRFCFRLWTLWSQTNLLNWRLCFLINKENLEQTSRNIQEILHDVDRLEMIRRIYFGMLFCGFFLVSSFTIIFLSLSCKKKGKKEKNYKKFSWKEEFKHESGEWLNSNLPCSTFVFVPALRRLVLEYFSTDLIKKFICSSLYFDRRDFISWMMNPRGKNIHAGLSLICCWSKKLNKLMCRVSWLLQRDNQQFIKNFYLNLRSRDKISN